MICNECKTVAHCTSHGCIPKQPAQQEPVAWRNAAIRIGEDLSSVGPDGYYEMTASQWLDWAMAQEPRGKTSPPAQRTWVGLTDKEVEDVYRIVRPDVMKFWRECEAKLKEKNT